MLDAGSALGRNCGPLLISKRQISREEVAAGGLRIAIPGVYTTANFLLGLAFPEAKDRTPLVFSEIEGALLDGRFDAAEIDRDLAAIDRLCANTTATFEQLFRSVNSVRLHDVQPKDGRFVATSYEVLVKEPGKPAQLKVAGAKS
mgnify:CR=1 FL=1